MKQIIFLPSIKTDLDIFMLFKVDCRLPDCIDQYLKFKPLLIKAMKNTILKLTKELT